MKPILKMIYSSDIDVSLAEYEPLIPDNFGLLIRAIVGEEKIGGEESFDMMLCTPKWLLSNHCHSDIIFGRHYLIVFEYNFQKIYQKIKNFIEEIDASTWEEIGAKIGRIGKWEFEDYQE